MGRRRKTDITDVFVLIQGLIVLGIIGGIIMILLKYYFIILPILLVCFILYLIGTNSKNKKVNMIPSHVPDLFVVVDIETTGLSITDDEIIEIGAIKVDPKKTNQTSFQVLIKPTKKITAHSLRINGITQEMVDKEGESLEDGIKGFLDFAEDLPLVAYNADFDIKFLKKAAKKFGISIHNDVSCALKMTRRAFPNYKSYRLCDVAKEFGLTSESYHRAVSDCLVTIHVYVRAATKLHSYR